MNTNVSVKDLTLKKGVILVTLLNIEPTKKSKIIIPGKKDKAEVYINDFPDHPFQAIVVAVGPGIEEQFPKGLKVGQVVYLDRLPNPEQDFVNIGSVVYAKIYVNMIFAVKEYVPSTNNVLAKA